MRITLTLGREVFDLDPETGTWTGPRKVIVDWLNDLVGLGITGASADPLVDHARACALEVGGVVTVTDQEPRNPDAPNTER